MEAADCPGSEEQGGISNKERRPNVHPFCSTKADGRPLGAYLLDHCLSVFWTAPTSFLQDTEEGGPNGWPGGPGGRWPKEGSTQTCH